MLYPYTMPSLNNLPFLQVNVINTTYLNPYILYVKLEDTCLTEVHQSRLHLPEEPCSQYQLYISKQARYVFPSTQSTATQQLAITDGRQGGQLVSCYCYFVLGCLNYEEKTCFTLLPQGLLIQKKTSQVKLLWLEYLAGEIFQINNNSV